MGGWVCLHVPTTQWSHGIENAQTFPAKGSSFTTTQFPLPPPPPPPPPPLLLYLLCLHVGVRAAR